MKRLVFTAFAALIAGSGWTLAQSQSPQTPLGPPTQMFEATDLHGNPVPARFYLTGGGELGNIFGPVDQETLDWGGIDSHNPGVERNWAGDRIDFNGYNFAWIGSGDPSCHESMEYAYPWPVNVPDSEVHCWNPVVHRAFVNIVGAVAPLTVTTASGPLVFHDWEVVDPEPGRCRTGNMGVRAIPDDEVYRGTMSTFAEGVEQRLRGWSADVTVPARFRAVYAPASPDVSAPLITVDTPRDCWDIPQGATATVSFSCRDLGSGVASCTAPPGYDNGATIDTSQPGDFSFDVIATDVNGNTRTRTVRYSVVDITAPTASPTVPPLPPSGWYASDVTVTWNWDDGDGLGLDTSACPATSVASGEGTVVVNGTCRDEAGNVASGSVTMTNVDTQPPRASPQDHFFWVEPDPVVQGQPAYARYHDYNDAVQSWFDGGSGLASTSCANVVTTTVGSFTVVCTAVDNAGNIATRLVPYTVIASPDTTKPTISIATPAAGAIYQRAQSVSASFTCSDEAGGSGLASCVGTIPSGSVIDTATPGMHAFTVTAKDNKGNTTTESRSYSVIVSYTFGGFAQPIDPVPTVNVGKAGKTYPVKFQLFELGVPVSDLAAVSGFTYKSTSCDAFNGDAADALETSVSGNTTLRYDATTSSFIYNWKTPTEPGCYALWLTLRTTQQFPAYFQLK